jgi:hypothetical protein
MRLEPREKIRVLARRQIPRQHLIEVVVTIDQTWQQDVTGEVEHSIWHLRKLFGWDMEHSVDCCQATMAPCPRRAP